jgi:hypothetical protein
MLLVIESYSLLGQHNRCLAQLMIYLVIKTDYNEHTLVDILVDCIFDNKEEAEKYIAYARRRGYGPRTIQERPVYAAFDWIKPELMNM